MVSQNNLLPHFEDEEQAKRVLLREGKKLEKIARKEWQKYLRSYTPVEYVRTGDSEKAIKLGVIKIVSPTEFGIELTWENHLAYHDSWLYKKGKTKKNTKGHAIMLISEGWHSIKLEKVYKKRVYRHTYFEGTGYLNKVYQAYMKVKDHRINLDVQWSGRFTKK